MSNRHPLFDVAKLPTGTPKRALAEARGFKVFDVSLPQTWLDGITREITKATGLPDDDVYWAMMTGTVWEYDSSLLGMPGFVTVQAQELFDKVRGSVLNRGHQ